jgi:hypothetical protein
VFENSTPGKNSAGAEFVDFLKKIEKIGRNPDNLAET